MQRPRHRCQSLNHTLKWKEIAGGMLWGVTSPPRKEGNQGSYYYCRCRNRHAHETVLLDGSPLRTANKVQAAVPDIIVVIRNGRYDGVCIYCCCYQCFFLFALFLVGWRPCGLLPLLSALCTVAVKLFLLLFPNTWSRKHASNWLSFNYSRLEYFAGQEKEGWIAKCYRMPLIVCVDG